LERESDGVDAGVVGRFEEDVADDGGVALAASSAEPVEFADVRVPVDAAPLEQWLVDRADTVSLERLVEFWVEALCGWGERRRWVAVDLFEEA